MKYLTLEIDSSEYEDCDDCLAAAAAAVAFDHNLKGYDLSPRWKDDTREVILVDVPDWVKP